MMTEQTGVVMKMEFGEEAVNNDADNSETDLAARHAKKTNKAPAKERGDFIHSQFQETQFCQYFLASMTNV